MALKAWIPRQWAFRVEYVWEIHILVVYCLSCLGEGRFDTKSVSCVAVGDREILYYSDISKFFQNLNI